VRVTGTVDGRPVDLPGLLDESWGFHARRTTWWWSAGAGTAADGTPVVWNLVDGVHDAPRASERTVWRDGTPVEVPPVAFTADLSRVGDLTFTAEAQRARDDRVGPFRSTYRQPFGRFAGTLPDGTALREGVGVMEHHDARW
jgi:hypothetical protein